MADRAAKFRVGLGVVAVGWLAVGGWLLAAEPPRPQIGLPLPPLPNAGGELPFPQYDPAAGAPPSTPLPAPQITSPGGVRTPGVTVSQKPQADPSKPPRPPEPGTDPFAEPPIAPVNPGAPGKGAAPSEQYLPDGTRINLPQAPRQRVRFGPRYSQAPSWRLLPSDDQNVQRLLYTGGVIVSVLYTSVEGAGRQQEVEFAADNIVAWIKGAKKQQPSADLNAPLQGGTDKTEVELYLVGQVVVRQMALDPTGKQNVDQVLYADEVYYDVSKNKSVALSGHLQLRVTGLTSDIHLRGKVIHQLSLNEIRAYDTSVNASKRPSDPGLQYTAKESIFTREETVRKNVFGLPYRNIRTGEPDFGYEQILTSYSVTPRVFNAPFFYLPRTRNDIAEPLGPLTGFAFGRDSVLGYRTYTTWDLFKLLGLRGRPGDRWQLFGDYFSLRGAAGGTEYDYQGRDLFDLGPKTGREGYDQPYAGFFRAYALQDSRKNNVQFPTRETDTLGGDRGDEPIPPAYRGRLQWRHNQELYENGTTYLRVMAQAEYLSDKNFLELLYKNEFDSLPNQETFAYLTGAAGNLGGSALLEDRLARPWVTETNWLPRADAHLIGQSFLNLFTYSARASAGYAELRPSTVNPLPVVVTDRAVETGRFNWNQRLDAPFDLGPLRIAPYGVVDLSYYTEDLSNANGGFDRFRAGRGDNMPSALGPVIDPAGTGRGRFYGGGGTQASLTFSRLYADATSELFNLNGLYHKATWRSNYFAGYSDTPYYLLPQLDRLNDDTTDQTYRTSRPRQAQVIENGKGTELALSPLFDPQQYAIRRLVDNKVDTLDSMQVVQLGLNQRLQTKRGYPGAQHVVDWMSLDLSASAFPDARRDNYGQTWGFLEYDFLWHFGDRFSFHSAGWYDPVENGPKYYNAGLNFNRPDGTNFFVSYRHTDPIGSRALTGVITYQLNSKYSLNLISTYDFGLRQSLSNQVSLARVGADVTMLLGFSFNPLINNFGFQFALVPNLAGLNPSRLGVSPILGQR